MTSEADIKKAIKQMSKARMRLVVSLPFFGHIALHLKFVPSDMAGGQGTAAVDNKGNLYFNPEFINKLTLTETATVICHEIMHIAQGCLARIPPGADQQMWNVASDVVCNATIFKLGNRRSDPPIKVDRENNNLLYNLLPMDWYEKYDGWPSEKIYIDLMKGGGENLTQPTPQWSCEGDQQGNGGGEGDENDGRAEGEPNSGNSGRHKFNGLGCASGSMNKKTQTTRTKREWEQRIAAAADIAERKGKGDVPGWISNFFEEMRKPTVTWKDHLRRTASAVFKGDYTWNRPSRRSQAIGMRLQSRKPTPKGAVIMMDTSGSISNNMLTQFFSECFSILKTAGCPWLHVYLHDVECYADHKMNLAAFKNLNIKVQRGGTSHIPVFGKVVEDKEDVGMIVAFTDLMSDFPNKAPRCPVLWGVPEEYADSGYNAPFGKKIVVRI